MLRLLVAEGNTCDGRCRIAESAGATPAESYADVLRLIAPDAQVDIFTPADEGATLPAPLDAYDGIAIGSSLNIYRREAASLRQIDFVREVFARAIPMFGILLGLVACDGCRRWRGRSQSAWTRGSFRPQDHSHRSLQQSCDASQARGRLRCAGNPRRCGDAAPVGSNINCLECDERSPGCRNPTRRLCFLGVCSITPNIGCTTSQPSSAAVERC
jgi:hypothetical protein